MSSTFDQLKPEKQQRIIYAAMEEFSHKGFELASTNEIVKKAKIGKGMLFHYFNTKKELFLFLCDTCFEILKTEAVIQTDERDVLERYRQFARLKRGLIHKHPYVLDFIKTMSNTQSEQVKKELEIRIKDFRTISQENFFVNIDETKFRQGIDAKEALRIIRYAMEGYENALQEELKGLSITQIDLEYDRFLVEFDAFIKDLQNCFYK